MQAGKNYVVKALAWSPDSTKSGDCCCRVLLLKSPCRLAVAQTDNIVFVYKLSSSPEKATEWFVAYLGFE